MFIAMVTVWKACVCALGIQRSPRLTLPQELESSTGVNAGGHGLRTREHPEQ